MDVPYGKHKITHNKHMNTKEILTNISDMIQGLKSMHFN